MILRAPLLRERLADYLAARAGASLLLVGEAPGFRGARAFRARLVEFLDRSGDVPGPA